MPGLIVKVSDDKNVFNYELMGIDLKAKFDSKIIAVPKEYAKDKPFTHKQFMALYNKKEKEYEKLSRVVQTTKDGYISRVAVTTAALQEKY